MTDSTNARELFRAAYENRYTWDDHFPGYNADVRITQGEETHSGRICIKPDLSVEVSGFDNEDVQQDVYTQLRDIVTHRKHSSFEKAHGQNQFSFGEKDDTGAIEIHVQGDAMGSNYKVRDREISQVSRVMGRMAFTIDTHETLDTGNGYVATRYDAIFRNPQTGEVVREMEFEDNFDKIGDYYIMTRQVVRSKQQGTETTTAYDFSNVKLLDPVAV